MDRSMFQRMPAGDSDRILEFLTQRQHIEPHSSIGQVLQRAEEAGIICPQASERALQWLRLSEDRLIGRMRRTELIQLSRSIYRFWTENTVVTG